MKPLAVVSALWLVGVGAFLLPIIQPPPTPTVHVTLIALTSLESGVVVAHQDERLLDAAYRRLIDATSGSIRTIVHAQTSNSPGALHEACADALAALADASRSMTAVEHTRARLDPAIFAADDTLRRYLGAAR